jgi:hypothetical protein
MHSFWQKIRRWEVRKKYWKALLEFSFVKVAEISNPYLVGYLKFWEDAYAVETINTHILQKLLGEIYR